MDPLRVLIVEDSEDDALLLLREIRRGAEALWAAVEHLRVDTADAFAAALTERWDVVIADYALPAFGALAALAMVIERGLDIPFLVISGRMGEEMAVEAMKSGAHDYFVKGNLARLVPAIRRELAEAADRRVRREAQAALRVSETQYRLLAENSTDMIARYNRDGRILYVSPASRLVIGYGPDELVGRSGFELLQPDRGPENASDGATEGDFAALFGQADIRTFTTEFRHKDGHLIWLETTSRAIFDQSGARIVEILSSSRDVSQRQRVELDLRHSEERFRLLIEDMHVGVLLQDATAAILLSNQTALELLGLTQDQLIGKSSFDPRWNVIREDGAPFPGPEHPVPQAIASRQPVRDVVMGVFRPISNDRVWLLVNAEPQLTSQGELIGVICTFSDITARKQAEAALREVEARYSRLASNTLSMVFQCVRLPGGALGDGLAFRFISAASLPIFGLEPAAIEGDAGLIVESIHPADRPGFDHSLDESAELLASWFWEGRLILPTGETRWIQAMAHPVRRDDGATVWDGLLTDISKRKHVETAMRESEAQYRLLAENATDLITRFNAEGLILYVSPACRALLGYEPQEMVGMSGVELSHPDDMRGVEQNRVTPADSPDVYTIVLRLRRKDGEYIWTETTRSIIRDGHTGAVIEVHSTSRDITERRRTEMALRRSEVRYRQLVETASDMIYQLTSAGRFIYVNQVTIRMTGYSGGELLEKHLLELVHVDDRGGVEASYTQQVINQAQSSYHEFRIVTKGGQTLWIGQSMQLVLVNDQAEHLQAVARDVTERRKAEQAASKANSQLTILLAAEQQRSFELGLLQEMAETVQVCLTMEEGYKVIGLMLQKVFPDNGGALAVITDEQNVLETVAVWGATTSESVFPPTDCWALRRGRPHIVQNTRQGLVCAHLLAPAIDAEQIPGGYRCIPMVALGETIGLLHLSVPNGDGWPVSKQWLVESTVEQLGLLLANLKLKETLRRQSISDTLTGLYNRRYLEEALEREARRASRNQLALSVLMIDIDHFKHFNDSFGHDAGDILLRAVGRLIKASIRNADIACRYGGEEFTIVMPGASAEIARARAEALQTAVKKLQLQHQDQHLGTITISVGVACFPDHAVETATLLRRADEALYEAKRAGRDQVVLSA